MRDAFDRRQIIAGGAAFAALAWPAFAQTQRLTLTGKMEQGSLAVGQVPAGTKVIVNATDVSVSPQGLFAFGFDWDQTRPTRVAAHYADGSSESRDVTPTARQYEVQHVNGLPQQMVTPPADVIDRIKREAHLIAVARTRDTGGTDFASGFDWPAKGIVSGVFGSQRIDNGTPMAPHFGVDIAGPTGTPIHAPADAIVAIADDYYLDGGFTLLDHGHGVSTCYLHQSKRYLKAGDSVKRGQLIGEIGQTGRATGPHLHWAMNWFQVKLDPSLSTRTAAPDKA
jgi:murein DD-endopeptidase MepM/ murein hydrolase activator NlpD